MKIRAARLWALAGLVLLLGRASLALSVKGYREVLAPGALGATEWLALAAIVVLFVWGEGWMALHRKWAPRVVGRIRGIDGTTSMVSLVLAPLHATGLVGAPRRVVLRTWAGVAAIVLAVVLVRQMPQPWQGMVKLGVAGALGLGVLSLVSRAVDPPGSPGTSALRSPDPTS